MDQFDEMTARLAVLDLLIEDERIRTKELRDRLQWITTTLGAMTTALAAGAAVLIAHLDWTALAVHQKVGFVVAGLWGAHVLVLWIDAIGGPLRRLLKPLRETLAAQVQTFENSKPSLDPTTTREALLAVLVAEANLARAENRPRESNYRQASWSAVIALAAVLVGLLH